MKTSVPGAGNGEMGSRDGRRGSVSGRTREPQARRMLRAFLATHKDSRPFLRAVRVGLRLWVVVLCRLFATRCLTPSPVILYVWLLRFPCPPSSPRLIWALFRALEASAPRFNFYNAMFMSSARFEPGPGFQNAPKAHRQQRPLVGCRGRQVCHRLNGFPPTIQIGS